MKQSNFDSEFEKSQNLFRKAFKLFGIFFAVAVCITLAVWGSIAYLVVSKGPETVQRIERIGDAYADKLEQENKKSE